MTAPKITAEELAPALAGAMPNLTPNQQRLGLAVYRLLALGAPVSAGALAEATDLDPGEIAPALDEWPGVFRDESAQVIGFWGLSLTEMPHSFRVGDQQLYTWCAWDALFIPELIGVSAEVESASPASGERVRLRVAPSGVERLSPETTLVSMLAPEEEFDHGVILSFCHFVHFFASQEDAEPWLAEHPQTFLLSVEEAFQLGRLTNRANFGAGLLRRRHPR